MLTIIILAALSVIVGVWILNKNSKSTTTETKPEVPTVEEEPIGYETGSFSPIVETKPKVKKTTAAKPKAPKAPKKPKNA